MVVACTPSGATFTPQECYHAILKISNISWDTSTADIAEFLTGASVTIRPHQIHIPIDRVTGKTRSDMYIEMSSVEDILRIMHQMNRRILKGRSLCMTMASFDGLYKVHFSDPEDGSGLGVSKSEATSLINICRNYKVYSLYQLAFLTSQADLLLQKVCRKTV
jgi:galactokinase/mevalonate kinase-like predicted kinase